MMEILYFIKALLLPSSFALVVFWLGVAMIFLKLRKKVGAILILSGGTMLTFFSSGFVATSLMTPLEYQYDLARPDSSNIRDIVILTGYAANDQDMSLSSQVDSHTSFRIMETMLLHRSCELCQIFISGHQDGSEKIKSILVELGIPNGIIVVDDNAAHTDTSSTNLSRIIGTRPFYLVTSAGHMPRSMGVFKKLGMNPVSAPTDFSLPKDPMDSSWGVSSLHLHYSDLAVNEYMGLIWYRLMSKI